MGEEKLMALLQESLATAVRTKAARPADFTKVAIEGSPHDLFKIVRRLYHPKTANCC
jgi:hypothetical protein